MNKTIFKKITLCLLILVTMLMSACVTQIPTIDEQINEQKPEKAVTVLYTNDIHAFLNNDGSEEGGISYAHLAQMKKELGENTLLVDAGDHIQGSVYGAMDSGHSVLEIMDGLYDAATIGNHEFDYGIDRTLYITENSSYPYISCNFIYLPTGEPVVKPHIVLSVGDTKIGFVGITTPETLTSSAPSYFQDENGEYIYAFLDGEELYSAVQSSVNALKKDGANYIIALGHVGVDELSKTTSRTIIENTTGIDAFIDGHSHTEIEKELVSDKSGNEVVLTQTGYYFGSVGKMTLSKDGIKTELIKDYEATDEAVAAEKAKWVQSVEATLGEKIGALGTKLTVNDENGTRLIRVKGTNLGEFVTDGYYYYVNFIAQLDCDLAIVNGGGVRADLDSGDVSYENLMSVNPFGDMLCTVTVTGQQILDMLEWGSRLTLGVAGQNEEGSFLHTAGLRYTVDTSIESTVEENEYGEWSNPPTGEYRVRDVQIYDKAVGEYVDIDLDRTYCLAGSNYILLHGGGGFKMLGGRANQDYIVEDYMALAEYVKAFSDTDGDGYADIVSENSPLCVYENYTVNYEALEGAQRARVIS